MNNQIRHRLLISFSSDRTELKYISISDVDAWWLDWAWVLHSITWVSNEILDLNFSTSFILATSLLILCVVLVTLSSRDCNLVDNNIIDFAVVSKNCNAASTLGWQTEQQTCIHDEQFHKHLNSSELNLAQVLCSQHPHHWHCIYFQNIQIYYRIHKVPHFPESQNDAYCSHLFHLEETLSVSFLINTQYLWKIKPSETSGSDNEKIYYLN